MGQQRQGLHIWYRRNHHKVSQKLPGSHPDLICQKKVKFTNDPIWLGPMFSVKFCLNLAKTGRMEELSSSSPTSKTTVTKCSIWQPAPSARQTLRRITCAHWTMKARHYRLVLFWWALIDCSRRSIGKIWSDHADPDLTSQVSLFDFLQNINISVTIEKWL